LDNSLKAHLLKHPITNATDKAFFKTVTFTPDQAHPQFIAKYQQQRFWLFNDLINYLIRFSQILEDRNTLVTKFAKTLIPNLKAPLVTVEAVKHPDADSAKTAVENNNQSIHDAAKGEPSRSWLFSIVEEARTKIRACLDWNNLLPVHYAKTDVVAVQSKKDPATAYLVTVNRFAKGWFPPNSQPSQN
jgi:hypothetical protein